MDVVFTIACAVLAFAAIGCAGACAVQVAQWKTAHAQTEGMRLFSKARAGDDRSPRTQDKQLKEQAGLAAKLSNAGIGMSPLAWRGLQAALTAAAIALIWNLCLGGDSQSGVALPLIASCAAVICVHLALEKLLSKRSAARMLLFEKQLAQIELQIAENSRSGLSASRSVMACSEQTDEPLKGHLKRLYNEITYSDVTLAEGFGNVARRTGSADAQLLAEVMSIQEQTGSNLAEALDFLHETIVRRMEMRQTLRSSLAETKITRTIVAVTPWAIFAFLSFAPFVKIEGFWEFYSTNPLGWVVLIGCIAIEAVVLLLISRMANLQLD